MVWLFVLFGILVGRVSGYASYMCNMGGKSYCTTKMTVGTVIMGGAAYSSTTRSIVVTRNGVAISTGYQFVVGDISSSRLSI